ncbi:MAG: helix-turn-helix domain-containing protein [Lachnospiraceae bacterium]|nr:helix-turn-helix domain-containing protein [Lachnospiraceae bacterium]
MKITELCLKLTSPSSARPPLPPGSPMNERLVCPEYSLVEREVKPFPADAGFQVFALLWTFRPGGVLGATMLPARDDFCCQISFTPNTRTQAHTHDYIELAIVVEGSFTQRLLDREICFEAGDLCLIDMNCPHQDILTDTSATLVFLGIAPRLLSDIMREEVTAQLILTFLQSALEKQPDLRQYLHLKPRNKHARETLLDNLHPLLLELAHPQAGTAYICKGLMMRIFRLLSTEYEFSLSKSQQSRLNSVLFEAVSAYIAENLDTISIRQLQDVFHYQEDYFNRLIRRMTGQTFSSYVQSKRLEKAAFYLITTSDSIEEIAAKVGYQNRGFFYRIFREKYGMTPAVYRAEQETS